MRKWITFSASLLLASVLGAALSGPFTLGSVLGWAVLLGAMIGPIVLFPDRYAEWVARCKFPRSRRSAQTERNPLPGAPE